MPRATEGQRALIRTYEKRCGMKPSPDGILEVLTVDQASKLIQNLKKQSVEAYFQDPTAAHTLRPTAAKTVSGATELRWLGELYRQLGVHFDEELWQSASKAEVLHEIGKLEQEIRPQRPAIDFPTLLSQYAEGDPAPVDKRATIWQLRKISNDLVLAGCDVTPEMNRQMLKLSKGLASQFIQHLVRDQENRVAANAPVPDPTWTPTLPVPTREEIQNSRSGPGAWKSATLAKWGVPWPPPRGWRERLEAFADLQRGT